MLQNPFLFSLTCFLFKVPFVSFLFFSFLFFSFLLEPYGLIHDTSNIDLSKNLSRASDAQVSRKAGPRRVYKWKNIEQPSYAFIAQESSESGWHSLGKNIIRCVLAQYHFLFSPKLVRIFHCTSVSRWVRTQGINQAPHLCILGVFWETPDWIPSWSPLWECCLCQQLCSGSIGFSLNISYDIPASGMTNSSEVVGLCEDLWPGPWLWLYLLRGDWKTEFNDETVNASFWPSVQTWTRQWYSMWWSKWKRGARTYSL